MTKKNPLSKTTSETTPEKEYIATIPPCADMFGGGVFKFATKKEADEFAQRILDNSIVLNNIKFFKELQKFHDLLNEKNRLRMFYEEELQKFYNFLRCEFNIYIPDSSEEEKEEPK